MTSVEQRNIQALAEHLKSIKARVEKLEQNDLKRDAYIRTQDSEIKRLNGIILAKSFGTGPTA